ncbi:MAG: anaerobic ribonucleoside-triphosphate reductase activating protein [Puniceicoccaceae bacterium]
MLIGSVEKAGEFDFPGKQAVVIYVRGCNLRCSYCGYASLLGDCDTESGHDWNFVENYLRKRLDRIDGVVFSGGEPTLQEDLKACLEKAKALGLATKLDTNGTKPDVLRELLVENLVDYVAMDVKAPLANYPGLVGRQIDTELIRTSVWIVKQSGIPHEFKTTVVPGLHTTRELKAIAELVHGADRFVVQDFVSSNPLRSELQGRPAFPHKPLEDIRNYIERRVKNYEIRHTDKARPMPVARRRMRQRTLTV